MKSERGVTLIELVLVIVLIGVIGIIGAQVFLYSTQSVMTGNAVREATQVNRMAMDRMIRELRMVRDEFCVAGATANSFTFTDTQNRVLTYSWSGISGDPLNRTENGVANILIDQVANLTFTYLDSAVLEAPIPVPDVCPGATTCDPLLCPLPTDIWSIQVDLTTQSGTETVQFRSRVHPRGLN